MAYPKSDPKFVWTPGRIYAVGDVVRASTSNTLAFKCIESTGEQKAGNTEPVFPNQITKTVEDNDIKWEAFEPLAEELLKLAPTAVIDLFEIKLTEKKNGILDTLRYHAGKNGLTEDLKFGGKTYPAVPVEIDGFEFASNGALPRPTMRVANVNNAITSLILLYEPLGAEVRRIRTFAKFLDTVNFATNPSFFPEEGSISSPFVGPIAPFATQQGDTLIALTTNDTADPDAKIVETWYIDRIASENQQFVEFELAPRLDLTNLSLPRRTIEEFCPWQYRGEECGYTRKTCFTIDDEEITTGTQAEKNALDVCGKRISSCQARFGTKKELPFGGFYGARLQA